MPFLYVLREAVGKVRLLLDMREMSRERVSEGSHPIVRQHFDRAPWAERARVEPRHQLHKMRGFAVEVMAKLARLAKLLLVEQTDRADPEKCSRQLVMVGISVRQ